MRVGVIVPVHGWAPYLAEALDSVLAETPDTTTGKEHLVQNDEGRPGPGV